MTASLLHDFLCGSYDSEEAVRIHPTACVDASVVCEPGVRIGPYAVIVGDVVIGQGTRVYPYVSIGLPAQNLGTVSSLGKVIIGKNCHLREYVSIHAPKAEKGTTFIGDNCYVMAYAHISHDVTLEEGVVVTNASSLAGHVYIEKYAVIMAQAALHQYCRVGQYSCLAACAASRQDIPPFSLFTGQPARFAGLNRVALKRRGFSQETIERLRKVAHLFFLRKVSVLDIKNHLSQDEAKDMCVQEFCAFIQESGRGVSQQSLLDVKHSSLTFTNQQDVSWSASGL